MGNPSGIDGFGMGLRETEISRVSCESSYALKVRETLSRPRHTRLVVGVCPLFEM